MAELKEVKLDLLDPNPFRDGGGGNPAATWVSVEEAYGYDETKLAELMGSFRANGVWAGMIARPMGKRYQLAFGHHRAEAARRIAALGEGPDRIPLIIEELSDDEMVKRMAAENSEEYGHDFALGVMNAVEAVVRAYGAGLVKLEEPLARTREDALRYAPGFTSTASTPTSYTALSVGKYLGWTRKSTGNTQELQATDRVKVALNALELIEKGVLSRTKLKGKTHSDVQELVKLTRRTMQAAEAKLEVQKDFLLKQKAAALKENDKNKVTKLEHTIAVLDKNAQSDVVNAGKAVVTTVADFHKKQSFTEALQAAAEKMEIPKAQPKKVEQIMDFSKVDSLTEKLSGLLLAGDSNWDRIMNLADEARTKKPFKELIAAMDALRQRCKDRSAELGKKVQG